AELRLIHPGELLQHQRVFRRLPEMETYKADLHRAEVAYVDRAGRRADFHALRKTFCTNLHRGGVPPRVAMAWMRHSDMKLTMRTYTDETALPLREALDHLPSFLNRPEDQAMRMTGTTEDGGRHELCPLNFVPTGLAVSS